MVAGAASRRAGGADGETHHGCFDALFLSEIPGFTVLCPASFAELRRMVRQALFEISGPVAVRYPRGGEGAYQEDRSQGVIARLREGADAAILTYGVLVNQALAAADLLAAQGIQAEVLKLNQISPLEYDMLAPRDRGSGCWRWRRTPSAPAAWASGWRPSWPSTARRRRSWC